MTILDQQITELAAQGLSPYQIEERLHIQHYTVHIKHHQALMEGYAREKKERTEEDRERERGRGYGRTYYEENKERILARQKERARQYYLAHKEEVKRRVSEWQKENRYKVNAKQRRYYYKKKAERQALQAASAEYRQKLLEQ